MTKRVVRDLSKYDGCGIVYDRANGYFQIDTNALEFQLGRELYDTQVLISRIKKYHEEHGGLNLADVDAAEVQRLLIAHCKLIHLMGQLRADYSAAMEVFAGRAEFREDIK